MASTDIQLILNDKPRKTQSILELIIALRYPIAKQTGRPRGSPCLNNVLP